MVPAISRPPMPQSGVPTGPEPIPRPADASSAGISDPSPRARPALSCGLANHRQSLENQGLTKEVVSTILTPHIADTGMLESLTGCVRSGMSIHFRHLQW